LIKVLGSHWPSLDDQAVTALAAALSLVVPFIPQEGLPCPDHLLLLPTALYRLFHSNINSQRLERIVAAMHGCEIASGADIVEVECVGAREVGIKGWA
jgi:hypothetical protein